MQNQLKRGLIKGSLGNREQWGILKAKETAAINNSIQLFRLIKEMSIRNMAVEKTVSEKDVSIIYSIQEIEPMNRTLFGTVQLVFSHFNYPLSSRNLDGESI